MMNQEYRELLGKAERDIKRTSKIIGWLRKNKPKDMDRVMAEIYSRTEEEIDCLACGNCCRNVGPLLRDRDIKNLAKLWKMSVSGVKKRWLRVDEEDDYVFRNMPCPFLEEDNRCMIYKDHPGACQDYPHLTTGKLRSWLKATEENTRHCPRVYLAVQRIGAHYGV